VIVATTIADPLLKVASSLMAAHYVDQLRLAAAEEFDVSRAQLIPVSLQRSPTVFLRPELDVAFACHPSIGTLADEDATVEHMHARLLEEGDDFALGDPERKTAHANYGRALEIVFARCVGRCWRVPRSRG
jgi:hypothetical protein